MEQGSTPDPSENGEQPAASDDEINSGHRRQIDDLIIYDPESRWQEPDGMAVAAELDSDSKRSSLGEPRYWYSY